MAPALRAPFCYTNPMKKVLTFLKLAFKTFILGNIAVMGGLFGLFVALIVLLVLSASSGSDSLSSAGAFEHLAGDETAEAKIMVLKVHGLILGEKTEETKFLEVFSDIGVTYGYEVQETLEEIAQDPSIQAVVLDINSPGGTIFGSKAIADGVATYRETTGKPVYSFVSGMAASGGYWSAVSTDAIFADAGTSMGSIGVIMGPFKQYGTVLSESTGAFGGVVETADGISTEYITAGNYKDLGNPYRALSQEERAVLQDAVDGAYDEFVTYVSLQRNISEATIKNELGALLYSDRQAIEHGLIDARLSKSQMYTQVAMLAQLESYEVVGQPVEASLWDFFLEAQSSLVQPQIAQKRMCGLSTQALVYSGSVDALCN